MADATSEENDRPKGQPLVYVLGGCLLLSIAGAVTGFFGYSFATSSATRAIESQVSVDGIAFVPMDQMIISLGHISANRHLRFTAQLEVSEGARQTVEDLMPRIVDVLNGYLRALRLSDFEDPAALVRLRSQMLRRVQVVVGDGAVRDLLVMEFVVS